VGAEPIETGGHLVPHPISGSDDHVPDPLSEELLRKGEAVFRRRADGIGVFLAGPSNVVYQLAWPEVGYGVVESKVESGQTHRHPFKRFRTTIGYLGVAMTGSEELRAAFREDIDKQHRQVRSGPDSPVKYNAFNRDLQLWVASCLYYGLRDIMIRMHGPMSAEEEELLLRLGSRFGTSLQVHPDMWHRDTAEFWAYWEEGMQRCEIPDPVRDYFRWLLSFELLPTPFDRLMGPSLRWLNSGFLVPELRDQLGMEWSERDQRRHDRILRTLGLLSRPLPHVVRMFPINAMVWNLQVRRRLGRPLT
jgi:uncharacterized protein (DUF2236 family)